MAVEACLPDMTNMTNWNESERFKSNDGFGVEELLDVLNSGVLYSKRMMQNEFTLKKHIAFNGRC